MNNENADMTAQAGLDFRIHENVFPYCYCNFL